jgi:hypothetical protein
MKKRCYNPNDKMFHRYGGRGISICKEWLSFESFSEWAVKHYKEDLQIDRIDNDGNYEPSNCRFVTCAVNIQNSAKAKITMKIAGQIRRAYSKGHAVSRIMFDYELGNQTVYSIIQNVSWNDPSYTPPPKRHQKSLSETDKDRAKKLFKEGVSLKALCEQFGKSKGSMHYILHGRK